MTRIVRVTYEDGRSMDYNLDTDDDLDALLDNFFSLEEEEEAFIKVLKVEEDWE